MKVIKNTGNMVTVELDADEASKLMEHPSFMDLISWGTKLGEAIRASWFEAGCPATTDGGS